MLSITASDSMSFLCWSHSTNSNFLSQSLHIQLCQGYLILLLIKKKKSILEFLLWLSGLKTQHEVHKFCEDAGSIPSLAQWFKDLVLPQAGA